MRNQHPIPHGDEDEEEDEEDAEAMVEEEESEFSHFEDDEEFENYRPVSAIYYFVIVRTMIVKRAIQVEFSTYKVLFFLLTNRRKMKMMNLSTSLGKVLELIDAVQHHHLLRQRP